MYVKKYVIHGKVFELYVSTVFYWSQSKQPKKPAALRAQVIFIPTGLLYDLCLVRLGTVALNSGP